MKKGILLSVFAVLFIGVIVFAIWYINEDGKIRTGSKEAFIPYNSALVVNVNPGAGLLPAVRKAFAEEIALFESRLLMKVKDTLQQQGYVLKQPYVFAMRVEGKDDLTFLYVMDNKDVLSRGEIADFLNRSFGGRAEQMRKYERYKIGALKKGKETVYFAVCDGIVLISDSDLYIEDGLKQFDLEATNPETKNRYQHLNKYFSPGAGLHVFLNTGTFSTLMPLFFRLEELFPGLDVAHLFKWGTLDGDIDESGVCLNGFLHYKEQDKSYMQAFDKQQPKEFSMDGVVPAGIVSFEMLNLSDLPVYFSSLDTYRGVTAAGQKVKVRKQQFEKMFGRGVEDEWQKLLQGEFAVAHLNYNSGVHEKEGMVMVALKSGSLGKKLVESMLQRYASFDNGSLAAYSRRYSIDSEESFTYYEFPAHDWASVYFGGAFEGLRNRYVFVKDNCLVLASSENVVKNFIRDHAHANFIRDAEWYRNLKAKLAGKSNYAYFAKSADVLPWCANCSQGEMQRFFSANREGLSFFPSFALQWSNEGGMVYNTFFLSATPIQDKVRPHLLWQTKLDAKVSRKPVPVVNHVTQERELFVQDDDHSVYLINDAGRILWKQKLDGPINSEVCQVDVFKNGKLQYLFSTSSRIYLIDRNGSPVGRFPLALPAACEEGITVYDYDGKRDYRIFAPCADRVVYLYDLEGKMVRGWMPDKADKPLVTPVRHFRVGGKDYIVFADKYRLYILDRKGKERVRVSTVFDLNPATDVYLTSVDKQARLVFAGRGGDVHLVDFAGGASGFKVEGLSGSFEMNVADVDGDGVDECVFTDGKRLLLTNMRGELLLSKELEAGDLGFPYVYRFSSSDIRIGVADAEKTQLLLLSADGTTAQGFPLAGDSPFSIVFFDNDGFFLFAGADNGAVIKYRVQR